jgi:hypothetical protein
MFEVFFYGIGVISVAGLAVMVYGFSTAPEGYEDKYGFHFGRPHYIHASRRRAAIRSRHDAKYCTLHRRKIAA